MAPAGGANTPENRAREKIDALLSRVAGWCKRTSEMNLTPPAVAVGVQAGGHGFADYPLFVDGQAVGVCRGSAGSGSGSQRRDTERRSTSRACRVS